MTALGATYNSVNYIVIEDSRNIATPAAIDVKNIIFTVSGYGLDSDTTLSSPTMSVSTTLNPNSTAAENVLFFVNPGNDVHYVRYVTSLLPNNLLLGADGYNTTTPVNHKCRALSGYGGHLHLLGPTENPSDATRYEFRNRDRWSDLTLADTWGLTGTTAGRNDLADTGGEILNAVHYDGNEYYMKSDSIIRVDHLAGETAIYGFTTVYQGDGLVAPKLVWVTNRGIIFVGLQNIWLFTGSGSPARLGDPVVDAFFDDLESGSGAYHKRAHFVFMEETNLLLAFVRESGSYPNVAWVLDVEQLTWTYWDFTTQTGGISAGCSYNRLESNNLVRGTMLGFSDGRIHPLDTSSENDYVANSTTTAIQAYWDSKEFGLPDGRWPELTNWTGIYLEAKGDNVTVQYSLDGGSWTTVSALTLSSTWTSYNLVINKTGKLIKVRFLDNTASSTFEVRRFALQHTVGGIQS